MIQYQIVDIMASKLNRVGSTGPANCKTNVDTFELEMMHGLGGMSTSDHRGLPIHEYRIAKAITQVS